MKQILAAIFALFSLSAIAQKTDVMQDANARTRNISEFHSIQVEDGIDLYLSESAQPSLAVSAIDAHYDKIISEVVNGVLKIYYKDARITGPRPRNLKAYVGFTKLQKISASGGADIVVKGSIQSKSLELGLSGGSDFIGKVEVTELSVTQSGGSDVRISGTADNIRIGASGGSDFKGYELQVANASLQVSGGSDAELSVSKELSAQASGGSDIFYKGNAVIKQSSSSGGGSISKRG